MKIKSKGKFRTKLCVAAVSRIEENVSQILAKLPDDTPPEVGDCIRREALDQFTAIVMNRLKPKELLFGETIERHIAESQRTATYLRDLYLSRRIGPVRFGGPDNQ